ncbi:MAG: O-methyltransferase [Thermoplasmata archaeon]
MKGSNAPGSPFARASTTPLGGIVPVSPRPARRPALLTPAARKAVLHHMLLFRQASLDRIAQLTESTPVDLKRFRRDLVESGVPEVLLQRGVSLPFTRELPQGALLYLMVRALRPQRIVETGVGPGYSTAWLLAGLDANRHGELISLGPGPSQGRASGVAEATVGQFVAPSLRSRWTLVLGNTVDRLGEILRQEGGRVDLFFYDNGPEVNRARFELRAAWSALSPHGHLLAHHVDANTAWTEICRLQGLAPQVLDAGPPPLGALEMRSARLA